MERCLTFPESAEITSRMSPAGGRAGRDGPQKMGGLLARELCRLRVEDAGARYLRGNQKGRNHGRHTDKSQELINGKHVRRPPRNWNRTRQTPHDSECQNRTATTGRPSPVSIRSEITAPEIVSSARRVMTVMVCIWLTSGRIVAEKVKVSFLFGTLPRNDRGQGGADATSRQPSSPRSRRPTPSPRPYGERVGVRGILRKQNRGKSPSPASPTRRDLSPQAGRGEGSLPEPPRPRPLNARRGRRRSARGRSRSRPRSGARR